MPNQIVENEFPGDTPEANIHLEVESRRNQEGVISVRSEKKDDKWIIYTEYEGD